MRLSLLAGLVPCFVVAVTLGSARDAHAGPHLGIDLDLGTAFQDRINFSYGLGGRFGWKVYLPGAPLWILPELGGHFTNFGGGREFRHAGAAFGGARFGFDGLIQPNIFSHLGLGYVGDAHFGPYGDIGIGIDFQLVRVFSLGAQVAYNTVLENGSPYGAAKWLSFGLNFGFDFTRPARARGHHRPR
jgi:hypothetical protein